MTNISLTSSSSTISVVLSVSTGAFSTLLLFSLCWAGVALGLPLVLSHAFVSLFTLEQVGSLSSLWTGGLSAFVSGGIAGALIAHCYNLAGRWLVR
jgi:hypothetical protein